MKIRASGILLFLTLPLFACSSGDQEDTEEVTSIEYEIPESICEDEIGATTPTEFFPPGKELSMNGTDLPGTRMCYLRVDLSLFFAAQEYIAWHDIDYLAENLFEVEPQGNPVQVSNDHEIHIWDNAAIARTACTVPPESFAHEYEQFGQNYYILTIDVVPPDDLENTRQLLEEYIVEAFDETFRTTPHCEESDAAAE